MGRGGKAASLGRKGANPRWEREETAALSLFVACPGGEVKDKSADAISVLDAAKAARTGCSDGCYLCGNPAGGICPPGVALQPPTLTSSAKLGTFRDCGEKSRSIFQHSAQCKDCAQNTRKELDHSQKLQERQWLKSAFLNGQDLIAGQISVAVRRPNVTSICCVAFACLCSLDASRDKGLMPMAAEGLSSRAPGRGRQEPLAVGRARCLQVLQQEQPLQGMALHLPQLIVPEHSARGHRDIVTVATGQQQMALSWENLLQQLG